jgi:hypothetical protein
MATQQIVPPTQHNPAVVVPIAPPKQITQTELMLFLSLSGRLQQLEEQVTAAHDDLKARLEAGAAVQPGDHVAKLQEIFRRNVSWKDVATRLADKLYFGKGLNYVERILRKTKPTRTVSLVVE